MCIYLTRDSLYIKKTIITNKSALHLVHNIIKLVAHNSCKSRAGKENTKGGRERLLQGAYLNTGQEELNIGNAACV